MNEQEKIESDKSDKIKYFVLNLENEFQIAYLIAKLKDIMISNEWKEFDLSKKLKWNEIAEILIRSELKQRKIGNMKLRKKFEVHKIE